MLDAVVAVYSDWGIGAGGTQPVTLKADRRHFRELTEGAAVIVGRRTLADFPGGKPLPGRVNIVLSRSAGELPGALTVSGAAEALAAAERYAKVFVIGGASVYRLLFPYLRRVFVTKLDCAPVSDAFFPNLDLLPDWRVTDRGEAQAENGVAYRFVTYERDSWD